MTPEQQEQLTRDIVREAMAHFDQRAARAVAESFGEVREFDSPEPETPQATDARSVAARILGGLSPSALREDNRRRLSDGTVLTEEVEGLVLNSLKEWPSEAPSEVDQAMLDRILGSSQTMSALRDDPSELFPEGDTQ